MNSKDDPITNLAKILAVLSHPTRLKILALCAVKERTLRELQEELGISKPLLIAHLRKLISSGFIESKAEIDKEKFIIRKYYKTREFDIRINDKMLADLLSGT